MNLSIDELVDRLTEEYDGSPEECESQVRSFPGYVEKRRIN
nr:MULTISPECIES: PqqD family peptide modification chaperone [Bacillaceae]